jgi:hypothetical protein
MANYLPSTLRLAAGAALLALALAGCNKPKPGEPTAPDTNQVPAIPAPDASSSEPAPPAEGPPADAAEPAPSPSPDAPPPTEPSPVPKPTADIGPSVGSMKTAIPSAKMSVPVDLKYLFDAEPLPNQAATLHLAAVPRVAGANLHVSVKQVDGLQVASGPLEVQKAGAAGIYRQQLSVTRSAAGPDNLRVLVTMDMPEGTAFGYFSVPLSTGNPPQKQESVKQR